MASGNYRVYLVLALAAVTQAGTHDLAYEGRVVDSHGVLWMCHRTALSPDERHLYVGTYRSTVSWFRRDAVTGLLTLQGYLRDFMPGMHGYMATWNLWVSADGRHVYAMGSYAERTETRLFIFDRDSLSGDLTCRGPTADGHDLGTSAAVSPDGRHLYQPVDYDRRIAWFSIEPASGVPVLGDTTNDTMPDGMVLWSLKSLLASPDGKHVYAMRAGNSASYDGAVWFSRDPVSGALAYGGALRDGQGVPLRYVTSAAMAPDGRHIYCAGTADDFVSWLVRDTVDGSLSPGGSFADRDSGVYGLSRLSGVAIDAEGRFVYTVAGDYSDGAVTWWHRDPQTGNLSFAGIARNRYKGVTQMREPRHITLTRDGAHAYVAAIGENNGGSYDAITAFSRDAATGELAFLDDYKDPDYGVPAIERASDIVIAPEGRDVYVASPSEYSVCWFRRDPIGGGLTYENHFDQPYHPDVDFVNWTYGARSMALNADGTRLYVAGDTTFTGGWHTWNMWTYERNPATGWLGRMQEISGFHESVPEFWNALWTAVSPDGAHVYVGAATLDDDPTGGILLFRVSYDGLWYVSTYRDSSFAMRGFCMAPDGAHIYAVPWNGPLIAYSRDSTSGYLSRLGPATGDPLPGYPTAAACSPDGRDVYVGLVDGIAHLTRDSSSGMLGLVGTVRNGTGGADGIVSPNQVVVSPDGLAVYALTDTALVWLTRDTTTGALEFDGVSYGSPDGTAGLRGGWRAALSPDQQHVYLVARREDAVVFYRVERGLVPVSHAPSAGGAEATARVRLRLGGRVFEVDAVSGVPGTSLRVQVLNSAGRVVACEYVDGIGERDAPCVLFPVLGAGAYVCRVSAGTRAMATRLVVVP